MSNATVKVPFFDLRAQFRNLESEIRSACERVMASCQFILGDEVRRFEERFAAYCRAAAAVAVNSGTSALHLALLAAGVGPGDEVITVPFTFVATVAAIRYTGARAVLVDVDPATLTIDPGHVAAAITPATKAIMPVHLYGQPADMDPILDLARRHGLVVIEDAAQAHGAEYQGRRAGTIGDLGCFSFYPSKNLGAYGEGGAVTTNRAEYAEKVRMLRDWGQDRKNHHLLPGFNYRMDGLQGAVLRVKLRHLEGWTASRRALAVTYHDLLAGSEAEPVAVRPDVRHVYHLYVVRVAARDRVREGLAQRGIGSAVHYPLPVHLQPAFADLGYVQGDFPAAEAAAERVLSLPMFPELGTEDVKRVARALRQVIRAAA